VKWLTAAVITVGVAILLARRGGASALPVLGLEESEPEAEQGATWWDDMVTSIDPNTYAQPAVSQGVADGNVQAFLMMLRYAEGTAGPDGYRTLFGGRLFEGFDDHPRVAVQFRNRAGQVLWTTAAGAYQAMAISQKPDGTYTRTDTWDRVKARLQLPDFSPESQDAFAVELIRERGALGDVMAGRLASAIRKCAPVWASLPGAGYNQPERQLASLQSAFQSAGGITEA
jgi:muramidase (phage lysozyme)